ncbi:MAG: hypothetical protein COW00_13470 [Bdellovibrio sp. CG12_big_fil_rev_8_21_14_0_65_39_13]|nr:MAG: hypothetical protein COW78_11520 [Bdellovibrio sp. CG22_combo_CG10-13_8_21_14_all_39_27]PIQ58940.1 MAG: hypothetical protein COW00_13470 [Bdellovibrio sp. CG12_big_fil_rev_8_21_14_0_65_39_13]PIR36029.1 MAG: hypothetical protein COV37_05840 [Bdellovibrio sp. CG11_big_fil_rev_8_21_14_0_20_39_38]PJB53532.1 MAG: hypothetical protein CO099_06560 [Bdellovibrio sp. CG_4_9_14_3_um_filter_39_7]
MASLKSKKLSLLPILTSLWVGLILLLGAWWLFLIWKMGNPDTFIIRPNLGRIIFWEGGTFIVLLLFLSLTFIALYHKDRKKGSALQAFFAGMTHELKTPLASVRLQSEVIDELAKTLNNDRLNVLVGRLLHDTQKLENQMDKILQLSRLESGGELNISSLDVVSQIELAFKRWGRELKWHIHNQTNKPIFVMMDEFAFELIMRNLIENTLVHSHSQNVTIHLNDKGQDIELIYHDQGEFSGDPKKLGQLFYKHNSKRGSGIGLYLIHGLMKQMKGTFSVDISTSIAFRLAFPKSSEEQG